MDGLVDIDELHTEINRYLPPEQQIQKGDPLFAGVVLNRVALNWYVRLMHKKLEEAVKQMAAASTQQTERSAAISRELIGKAGNQIERQVDVAARQWEERLRLAGIEGEACIRRACWLAWTGAMLIFISACIAIGSFLGNAAFGALFHTKQPPSKQVGKSKHREGSKCQTRDGCRMG